MNDGGERLGRKVVETCREIPRSARNDVVVLYLGYWARKPESRETDSRAGVQLPVSSLRVGNTEVKTNKVVILNTKH